MGNSINGEKVLLPNSKAWKIRYKSSVLVFVNFLGTVFNWIKKGCTDLYVGYVSIWFKPYYLFC